LRLLFRTFAWLGSGVILGLGLGLFLGWVAWPTEFTEADPTVLEDSFQRDYALMIAAAYWQDQDLGLARRRLGSLGKEDVQAWFLSVTVDHILEDRDPEGSRFLARLAADMDLSSPVMQPFLATESTGGGQ
jgi:hypothetical protein